MTIGIIVEFELVDITAHDAKGLAKILFKIFPQCFAVQKARELVGPATLIELLHCGTGESCGPEQKIKPDDAWKR